MKPLVLIPLGLLDSILKAIPLTELPKTLQGVLYALKQVGASHKFDKGRRLFISATTFLMADVVLGFPA